MKIVDFGIAKDVGLGVDIEQLKRAREGGTLDQMIEHTGLGKQVTRLEAMVGTPLYMAPEQVKGRLIDGRCDQYALGVILYQMLTERPPFVGQNPIDTIFLRLMNPPLPPRQTSPSRGISTKDLEALTMRCLALEPGQRYASMNEVAEALEREVELIGVARGERKSIAAGTASLLSGRLSGAVAAVPQGFTRRNKRYLIAAAACALIGIIAGVGLYLRLSQKRQLSKDELLLLEQRAVAVLNDCMAEQDTRLRVRTLAALADTHDLSLRPKIEPWLRVSYPEVQAQAAATLGALGDSAAASRLVELYETSAAPIVRMSAVRALDQIGDPRGAKLLREALAGRDEETRMYAGFVLCENGEPPAIAMVEGLLQGGKLPQPLLLSGLGCLSRAGLDSAKEQLATLSSSASREMQLGAAVQLLQSGDPRGRLRLGQIAGRSGPDQLVAARLLAGPEEPERAPTFRAILENPRSLPESLVLAMEGLGGSGELSDLLRLEPQLQAGRPSLLRQTAAGAIVQIAHRDPQLVSARSLDWTRSALADANWMTRLSATAVLGDSNTTEAVALLSRALKDRELQVRRGAARALGRQREEPALRALREGLSDGELEVRLETLRALSRLGPRLPKKQHAELRREVQAWIQPMLDKGSRAEQIAARGALLRLGDNEQVTRLRQLYVDSGDDLRVLIVEQLAGKPRELRGLLKDANFAVRFTAARLLAQRGDKRALPVLTEGLGKGGATALLAYGLMRRLGSDADLRKEAEQILERGTAEERSSVIAAWAMLPLDQALDLLGRAAFHAESQVRMQVVEALADLLVIPSNPAWIKIMRRLSRDAHPAVRARAGLLLSRVVEATRKNDPTQSQEPALEHDPSDDDGVNPPPVEETTAAPEKGVDKQASSVLEEADKLVQQARATKVPRKAQKLYDKARVMCRSVPQSAASSSLIFEIGVRLGQLHEEQDQWAEAMTEYQSALSRVAQVKGKPDLKAAAQGAAKRLSSRLGQVVMTKQQGGRCREETVWMPTGTHILVVGGKSQSIKVTAGATVRAASCK